MNGYLFLYTEWGDYFYQQGDLYHDDSALKSMDLFVGQRFFVPEDIYFAGSENPVPSFGTDVKVAFWPASGVQLLWELTSMDGSCLWFADQASADRAFEHSIWDTHYFWKPSVYKVTDGIAVHYRGPGGDGEVSVDPGFITGSAGDDDIVSPSESAAIDGKEGTDTVHYAGPRADFSIEVDAGGSVTIVKPGGTDVLVSIERATFSDGTLLFDISSDHADAAYRLYGGAFDRTPDEGGLLFWSDYLDHGGSLLEAAGLFLESPEFAQLFGTDLSNNSFVEQLYLNVLGRPGEQAGIDFWKAHLDNGGNRAAALVDFTQLPEYVGLSQANIENGYWVVG